MRANSRPDDVVVIGGLNTDFSVRGRDLPTPDHPVSADEFVTAPGGKGLNQAVAAARLGASVTLVGSIGDDERGRAILRCLEGEHVDTRFVVTGGAPTGVSIIHVDANGRKQTAAALGANTRLSGTDVETAAAAIAASRVLLVQLEVPLVAVERAMASADAHRVTVVLDPAPPRSLPDSVLARADIIKPNAAEAHTLTGVAARGRESAVIAAHALLTRGARNVIVSTDTGTIWVSDAGERWYGNLPVQTVDTTGAGDAFAGALAAALVEGELMGDAIAFAHAAAAMATTKFGALPSLPRRHEVEHLLRSTYA
ncbi:MAG: PfkB family carbohydrate kinase [Vicinamibacterales bacterium]